MKKLFNSAETMVDDMIDGFVTACPQVKRGTLDPRVVVRRRGAKNPDEKVTLLIGNGAGHEPIAPASPAPFTPIGLVVQGTLLVSNTNDGPSAARGIA